MIAKGTTHNNGAKLGRYMITGKKNERAELFQLRGFAEDNIVDAFRSIHILADATHCDKPFFHTQVRNPEGEQLTREQWEHVANRIEAKLGYTGQPRAIAFHTDEKTGHEHMHIAWSRIDEERMVAKPLPFFKLRLKEVCRELEDELDLIRVSSERPSPEMAPTRDEDKQARRLGVDVREVRAAIRLAWEQADSGRAFVAALEDQGLILCQGDRRDYVVLDSEGGLHALGKRVLGTTAAETRARMTDIDHSSLPTIEEARVKLEVDRHRNNSRGEVPEAESHPIPEFDSASNTPSYSQAPNTRSVKTHSHGERDLTRDESTRQDAPTMQQHEGVDLQDIARSTERLAGLAFDIGEKLTEPAIEGMAISFESLFDVTPKPTPQPKPHRDHGSPPNSGPIDHWRYLSDEKYHKEILSKEADEQARQQRIRDELERTGQSRDRER